MRSSSLPIALAALLFATPLLAQDAPDAGTTEAPAEETQLRRERPYKLWIEVTPWYVQPAGLELDLVTEIDTISSDLYRGRPLPTPWGTDDATRWRGGVTLPKDAGAVTLSYWSTSNRFESANSQPGSFLWGTNLAYGAYAGIFDDSLADTYEVEAQTATRDLRIAYQRALTQGPKVTTFWSVGVRWVDANLVTGARYSALGAPIPALYNPPTGVEAETVFPISDIATSEARFSGRGLSTGLEVRIPLGKRFEVDGSVDLTLLRGDRRSSYSSRTSIYLYADQNGTVQLDEEGLLALNENPSLLAGVFQTTLPLYVEDSGTTASTFEIEAHLGVRAKVWRTLEVLGGIRMARYEGILSELRPLPLTSVGAKAVPGLERTERSLAYEGFYFGAAYTF